MKKILTLSVISVSMLLAGPVHDLMDNRIKGKSYSGNQNDYDAAKDGLGVLPLQHHTGITSINNELLVQKVLKKLEKSENDLSKKENILNSLNTNSIGTVSDQNFVSNLNSELSNDNTNNNTNLTYLQSYLNFTSMTELFDLDNVNDPVNWTTEWHAAVDNLVGILTVVTFDNGQQMGLYNNTPFDASYKHYSNDTNSFITDIEEQTISPVTSFSNAIYSRIDYGPTFGGGHDFVIKKDKTGYCYTYSYNGNDCVKLTGSPGGSGNATWTVTGIKSYQLNFN